MIADDIIANYQRRLRALGRSDLMDDADLSHLRTAICEVVADRIALLIEKIALDIRDTLDTPTLNPSLRAEVLYPAAVGKDGIYFVNADQGKVVADALAEIAALSPLSRRL